MKNGFDNKKYLTMQSEHIMERIAQLVVMPFLEVEFDVVDELENTKRGDGGFGSTGVN